MIGNLLPHILALSGTDHSAGPLGPFGWNEPSWVAFGSAASAVVALATLGLAIATTFLAKETKGLVSTGNIERAQVERHHQQVLTPLVVIDADCQRAEAKLRFFGKIRNIGPGPATAVYFCVKPTLGAAAEKYGRGLAAGEVWDFDLSWDMGLESGINLVPYDCLVCFMSIFVTEGVVQQYSHSGRRLDLSMRTMILPDRSTPREVAELKAAFLGALHPLPALGEMGPR